MGWPIYAIYGGILAGQYIYHRLTQGAPPKPKELEVPRTEEGTTVPLLYGRTLVRAPILAWIGNARAIDPEDLSLATVEEPYIYAADMLFVLGVPFSDGIQRLHNVFIGDMRLSDDQAADPDEPLGDVFLEQMTGDGDFAAGAFAYPRGFGMFQKVGGNVELLNGKSTQMMVDYPTPTPRTNAAFRMAMAGEEPSLIPGYRGLLSVFLWREDFIILGTPHPVSWFVGTAPQPGSYSFEISTYPAGFSTTTYIGVDVNPTLVISNLLTGRLGKLGLPTTIIDAASFHAAAVTLKEEGNGYSRCLDELRETSDIINEILEQIDAVLYEDWSDGETASIKIKLIRGDYNPATIPHITPANCSRVESFAASGLTDVINRVRVIFTDRAHDYIDGSAMADNQANLVAQGGRVNEAVLHYPGVHTYENAANIAARELAARSRPMTRCRVVVDRTFLRVNPGDAVRLTWPEYHLSQRVYRVAAVDRGTLEDGSIRLELIEDFFYVRRGFVYPGGSVLPLPNPNPVIGLGD